MANPHFDFFIAHVDGFFRIALDRNLYFRERGFNRKDAKNNGCTFSSAAIVQ
jgi:hypothetical protein